MHIGSGSRCSNARARTRRIGVGDRAARRSTRTWRWPTGCCRGRCCDSRSSRSRSRRARSGGCRSCSSGSTASTRTAGRGRISIRSLTDLPSTQVPGRVFGCFFDDMVGVDARHRIGVGQLVFETDYPHQDSTWPDTPELVARDRRAGARATSSRCSYARTPSRCSTSTRAISGPSTRELERRPDDLRHSSSATAPSSTAPASRPSAPTSASSAAASPTIGRIRERGTTEIDAEGHAVTPGFIDGHTHMDAQVFWDQLGTNSCWHGVTTVVMGNCGFTLAPSRHRRDGSSWSATSSAPRTSPGGARRRHRLDLDDASPSTSTPSTACPKGINYAANIGHSALRTYVMGERAFEGEATDDDLDRMKAELHDALHAGALGFTTSRTMHHQTSDDRPVASRLASWDEVVRLVEVLGELGAGIFQFVEDPTPPACRDKDAAGPRALGRDRRALRPSRRYAPRSLTSSTAPPRPADACGASPTPGGSEPSRRSARSCRSIGCPYGASCARFRSTSSAVASRDPERRRPAGEDRRRGPLRRRVRRRGAPARVRPHAGPRRPGTAEPHRRRGRLARAASTRSS